MAIDDIRPSDGRDDALGDHVEVRVDQFLARLKQNAEFVNELRSLNWMVLVLFAVVILFAGAFAGFTWEQHNVADVVVGLQNQVGQLQQAVQTQPTPAADPAGQKHTKKK